MNLDIIIFSDLTCGQQIKFAIKILLKLVLILGFLYLFICALGFLSDAFQLVGGRKYLQ